MTEGRHANPQDRASDGYFDIGWAPPVARGVPRLRARMVEQMQSSPEFQRMMMCVSAGRTTPSFTSETTALTALKLLNEESERLASAALYYVTADMTQLAVAAAGSLPDFELEAEDVPAPSGFMVFADPVHRYDEPGDEHCPPLRVPIVAMSWGPSSLFAQIEDAEGIWITLWSPTGDDFLAHLDRSAGVPHTPVRLRELHRVFAPLQWDNEMPWQFGKDHADASRGKDFATAFPMQVLRAAWLLMQQPQLLDATEIPRPRSEQKLDARHGLSDAPVRVLHLRHVTHGESAQDSSGEGTREYHRRWLVSGHWRQQWHPKRGIHRPMWIAPHVKGPSDKPLITPETVHLWDR